MTYRLTAAIAAAALLAACSGQGGNDQTANGTAGGEVPGDAASGAAGAGLAGLQAGEWETTVEVLSMEMPGMPAGMPTPTIPAVTTRHCLTPEEAAQPNAEFFSGNTEGASCERENFTIGDGRVSGIITCTSEGATMRSEMNGQFGAASYEMTARTQTTAQGMTMNGETRITARRVGDCPAG